MNLGDLLDELRRNMLRDTSTATTASQDDYLWTDPSLVRYINEAYLKFCQLTEYIQDATTPETCRIVLQEGVRDYALNPAVLRIMSVEHGNLTVPIVTTDYLQGDRQDSLNTVQFRYMDRPGVVGAVPDYELGMLKLIGTPTAQDAGTELVLRVTRLPLVLFSLDDTEATPEIPERFHLDMLEWAAFRCLRNHDADGENMAKASAHKTRFNDAVEEAKEDARTRKFVRIGFGESWRWC